MSVAAAKSALRGALAPLGFAALAPSLWWARTDELFHVVRCVADRRITGRFAISLHVWYPRAGHALPATAAAIEACADAAPVSADLGDASISLPADWDAATFDADHAAARVADVGGAFSSVDDVRRHLSDRYRSARPAAARGRAEADRDSARGPGRGILGSGSEHARLIGSPCVAARRRL